MRTLCRSRDDACLAGLGLAEREFGHCAQPEQNGAEATLEQHRARLHDPRDLAAEPCCPECCDCADAVDNEDDQS